MNKEKLIKIIAAMSIFNISCQDYIDVEAKQLLNEALDNKSIKYEICYKSPYERLKALEQAGIEVKKERERLEKLEEERRLEEERKAAEERAYLEEVRKDNVSVNLDNVLQVSNINAEELLEVFDYYNYSRPMKELAYIIVEAERTYGINAFIISSIISWESAYNTSHRAVYDNNVLGWGVYNESATGINASSKYENIMNACSFLSSAYLSPEGIYFNGYSTWSINQRYCLDENGMPDDEWRIGVNSIAKNYEWIYKNVVRKV